MTAGTMHRPDGEWMSAPVSNLIDHIVETHHKYLGEALPRLSQLAAQAAAEREGPSGEGLQELRRIFLNLKAELESHLWKEEMVLFPLVKKLEAARDSGQPAPPSHCGSVANPIRVMRHEHDNAEQALAELRNSTSGYVLPADASVSCQALFRGLEELEADLHRHIHLENDILFPRASKLQSPAG